MTEERINLLILKYIRGICSPVEQDQLKEWLNVSENNRKYFEHITLIEAQLQHTDTELDLDEDDYWKRLQDQLTGARPVALRSSGLSYLLIAAAGVVFIAVVWLLGIWISRPAGPGFALEYITGKGEFKQIELPDGSKVHLNADTRIFIEPSFNKGRRHLNLQGEAFFEVSGDPLHPLIVNTANTTIEVLGTSFNVSSYPESPDVEVAVVEGAVAFKVKDAEPVTLEGEQTAVFNKINRSFTFRSLDKYLSLDWLDGRMVFREMPLKAVYTALERKFAVQIDDRSGLGHLLYSNTLEPEDSLNNFLSRLCLASGLAFLQEGETITITGK